MLVLKIIGILFIVAFVISSLFKLDSFFCKKFKKDIHLETTSIIISISYIVIYLSYQWYLSALSQNGDIYNGLILIGITFLVILSVIVYNIKQSNLVYGLALSIYQLIACVIGTGIIIFVVLSIVASNTRPVINLN